MKRKIEPHELVNNNQFLTLEEKEAKYHVIDQLIEEGGPVALEELDIDKDLLAAIIQKGVIVVVDGMVHFAYPVSGLQTVHGVTLSDGRSFSSMCAIDALGSAFAFHQAVDIHSQCAVTGEPIVLRIENGEIVEKNNPEIHVIHVNLNAFADWSASC